MEKKLNVFDLTSIGVGTIIGAGVFSMLGYGIAYTGRGIVLALFLAMALVILQSIRYPILANVFELDGGMYALDALTCPRVCAGFTAANDVFFKLGTQSVTVIAFAMYLEPGPGSLPEGGGRPGAHRHLRLRDRGHKVCRPGAECDVRVHVCRAGAFRGVRPDEL